MINVILCDDHELVRKGIRNTLESETDIRIVAEAENSENLKNILRQHDCDVLLLDISMPGRSGLELVEQLTKEKNPTRVLIVSMHPEKHYALRSLRAGAHGYFHKSGNPSQMIGAVRLLAQGRYYVPPEISELLVTHLKTHENSKIHDTLSQREMDTLKLIGAGQRLTDIARKMMISPKTVSVYRSRILEKLNLSSNGELILYSIENNLNH
ncbi:response regulator [Limnohabitans planktonicus]|uniref:DNA-binding response regulator n=1 Tax=Limnohabitans planktonicus II-D5 TaxID=1293045 RepID=A0A2T7UJ00_9BURK|nr:response regulator transcription factor [Limnohabitans planktonicus]PVE44660.1 DNA-binding response regulator [Limnohabitans planktonicus II-D5]